MAGALRTATGPVASPVGRPGWLPPFEFWPVWATYAPLVPWILALAMRHGWRAIGAANPGMRDGGLVGESKYDILESLPAEWIVPSARIDRGTLAGRTRAVAAFAEQPGHGFPLILKPDVGQRGSGVRRAATLAEAVAYLRAADYPVVVQPWHPGPFEAGIFYWRHPDAARGQILSITDKVFPVIAGDGVRTLEALILSHSRFSRQAPVFLQRHAASLNQVLPRGERFALGSVGNHCQGTLFRSGAHLWTPELDTRIDDIARRVPGFCIGRFDVRYGDVARFKAGEDLAIIELNGVSAEPTDVYDPDRRIASAYRALFEQWRLVFEIGAANRRRGAAGTSPARLARLALGHVLDRRRFPGSS
ncbi:MAG: carboxylate--amine ligase [Acidobacteria bacterium]|nr:carboxylate--amine ligase [Acidobacteriota bacterium]